MGVHGGAVAAAGAGAVAAAGEGVVAVAPDRDPLSWYKCSRCTLPGKMYRQSFIAKHKRACKEAIEKHQRYEKKRAADREKKRRAHGKPKKW